MPALIQIKKLMIAAAVAAMIGAVQAENTEITSANTVGYQGFEVQPDTWKLVASQFDAVSGDAANLSDLVSGDLVAVDFDEDFIFTETAPEIDVGSEIYYYINFEGETFWFDFNAGGPAEEALVEAGTAVWIRQNSGPAVQVNFAGAVPAAGSKDVDLVADTWNLIANPYPVSFALTDVTFDGLVGVDFDEDFVFTETAPELDAGDAIYYYINYESETFWFDFNAGGPYEGDLIPSGTALWFKAATDVTATFSFGE